MKSSPDPQKHIHKWPLQRHLDLTLYMSSYRERPEWHFHDYHCCLALWRNSLNKTGYEFSHLNLCFPSVCPTILRNPSLDSCDSSTQKWTAPQASPTHGWWTPAGVGPEQRWEVAWTTQLLKGIQVHQRCSPSDIKCVLLFYLLFSLSFLEAWGERVGGWFLQGYVQQDNLKGTNL